MERMFSGKEGGANVRVGCSGGVVVTEIAMRRT